MISKDSLLSQVVQTLDEMVHPKKKDLADLCEEYFWKIDAAKGSDEYRLSVKGLLCAFACEAALIEADTVKPKTKVEYVKCDYTYAWEAMKAFECGNVFYTASIGSEYIKRETAMEIVADYNCDSIYRRVEAEVTWQDELADKYPVYINGDIIELTVTEFHKDAFLEMCSFVHNANK